MERHLLYGITQCYLPPITGERARLNSSQVGRYSIYLLRRDGRLVDLGGWLLTEMVYLPAGSHPSKY